MLSDGKRTRAFVECHRSPFFLPLSFTSLRARKLARLLDVFRLIETCRAILLATIQSSCSPSRCIDRFLADDRESYYRGTSSPSATPTPSPTARLDIRYYDFKYRQPAPLSITRSIFSYFSVSLILFGDRSTLNTMCPVSSLESSKVIRLTRYRCFVSFLLHVEVTR